MSGAFVTSILAFLLINVYSTMAFSSNVHEKMSKAQRFSVFGSEDSIPDYQVFPMSLSGARRGRKSNQAITLKIEIAKKKMNLTLRPTAGYLATKYTPVWLAKTDEKAFKNIRYHPLPMAMTDIGKFRMYHDVENNAAIVMYTHPTEGDVIEGIISHFYAIKSLPKDLMKRTLIEGGEITRKKFSKKRSVTSDVEEDTDYVVVFKVPAAPNDVKPSAPVAVDPNNIQREKRAERTDEKQNVPEAVYPEILLVLDYNAIRNHTITQALRFMLAFWNGVDLSYRTLDKPKAYLNIAAIIISGDDLATPYLAENTSMDTFLYGDLRNNTLSSIGRYFFEERVRFPMKSYDMIVVMTTIGICPIAYDCNPHIVGHNPRSACTPRRIVWRNKAISSTAVVGYNWEFTGLLPALVVTINILGVKISGWETFENCYLNAGTFDLINGTYTLENCSRTYLSRSFLSKKTKCLDNKPAWIETVGKVLPGRWMSLNGQCRNKGYAKGCRVANKLMCEAQGCQNENSLKCKSTGKVPLQGSECETNKYCNAKRKCVHN